MGTQSSEITGPQNPGFSTWWKIELLVENRNFHQKSKNCGEKFTFWLKITIIIQISFLAKVKVVD